MYFTLLSQPKLSTSLVRLTVQGVHGWTYHDTLFYEYT